LDPLIKSKSLRANLDQHKLTSKPSDIVTRLAQQQICATLDDIGQHGLSAHFVTPCVTPRIVMPSARFSARFVKNLAAPRQGRVDHWDSIISADDALPGSFGLRVFASGVKSWQIMYRVPRRDGTLKQKRLALATYPAFGLSEARELAREALKKVARGADPAEDRKVIRAKLAAMPTVEEAAREFIEHYAKPRNRSWRETQRIFERYVFPVWGERLLPTITKSDVADLLTAIAAGGAPYMANRVLAAIRRFWNWSLEQGKTEISPVANVKAPAREISRDRILSDEEIAAVWRACESMGWPFGPLIQLLIVTGQREDEVAGMRWSEVDLERALWTLPREASKSDRLNQVPLPPLALQILDRLPRSGDLVFSTTGKTPVSGFSKAKTRCDQLSGVSGWRLHDLRRTVASGMARLKVEPWVVEKVLNHQTGQLSGVAGVYNRWGYSEEKREALSQWALHLEEHLEVIRT
jgi:integrase